MSATDADEDYPWPVKGDDPFALGDDLRNSASLNFAQGAPWYVWHSYARGFKLLGDLGVRYVEETARDQNVLVYSILYSYRHYIELALKSLVRDARLVLAETGDAPGGHVLMNLWNTATPLLRRVAANETDLENVGAIIARFDELDRDAQTWRYPVDLDGNATVPADIFNIDLCQVRDVVDRLAGFLDIVETHIGACLDY